MAGYEKLPSADRAKLFRSGGSQAVRLPKEYRFDGEEVAIHREGDRVILEPMPSRRPRTRDEALSWLKGIQDMVGPDFPDRDQPTPQERDWSAFD